MLTIILIIIGSVLGATLLVSLFCFVLAANFIRSTRREIKREQRAFDRQFHQPWRH